MSLNVATALRQWFIQRCEKHGVRIVDFDGLVVRRQLVGDGLIFLWSTQDQKCHELVLREGDARLDLNAAALRLEKAIVASLPTFGAGLVEGEGSLL